MPQQHPPQYPRNQRYPQYDPDSWHPEPGPPAGQSGSPCGWGAPPNPGADAAPARPPRRSRAVPVLIAVAALAAVAVAAALALLRPWEDTRAEDEPPELLTARETVTPRGASTAPATPTQTSADPSTSTAPTATVAPGLTPAGFVDGLSCRDGATWVYAARTDDGEVLVCDDGGGLYYADNFGSPYWETPVTATHGDRNFEMTTAGTTIFIDGDRMWRESNGTVDGVFHVRSAYVSG